MAQDLIKWHYTERNETKRQEPPSLVSIPTCKIAFSAQGETNLMSLLEEERSHHIPMHISAITLAGQDSCGCRLRTVPWALQETRTRTRSMTSSDVAFAIYDSNSYRTLSEVNDHPSSLSLRVEQFSTLCGRKGVFVVLCSDGVHE